MRTIETTTKVYEGVKSSVTRYSLTPMEAHSLEERFKETDIASMRKEYTKNGEYCQEFHFLYGNIVIIDTIKYGSMNCTMEEEQLA